MTGKILAKPDANSFEVQSSATPLAAVEQMTAEHFAITGDVITLSSEKDETFLIRCAEASYVLKIAHPAEDPAALIFQTNVLLHLQKHAPTLPVPHVIHPLRGEPVFSLNFDDGSSRLVRMLTFLEGKLLYQTHAANQQMFNLGSTLAALGLGLKNYALPVPDIKLIWDLTHAADLMSRLNYIGAGHRDLVSTVLSAKPHSALKNLPVQVIHNDFNPHNILVRDEFPDIVSGVIDFGDLVQAPIVNDIAVALSYQIGKADGLKLAAAFLQGYHVTRPLYDEELACLPALIRTRIAMTITISEWRAILIPENSKYILRNHSSALAGLQFLSQFTDNDLTAIFKSALGEQ